MSNWSIAEQSDSRLVAQSMPPTSPWSSQAMRGTLGLIAYIPGFVALLVGLATLPGTMTCQVSAHDPNGMECRRVKQFFQLPIQTETTQLSGRPLQPFSQNIPGDITFFGLGCLWLGGLTAGLAFAKVRAPRKTNWTFDRTTKTVHQQPVTLLSKSQKTFSQSDIHSLVLEVPDLATNSHQTNIFVRLNMNAGETPTQYLFWNENQPAVYAAPYPEFSEVVTAVIQPICQILDLPWQLKFFHQDECFIFDFAERVVDRYLNGEQLLRIEFSEIVGFELEEAFSDLAVSELLVNLPQESVHYLNIVLQESERLRIHQFISGDAQDIALAKEWMNQLHGRLSDIVKMPAAA